jgi:hypothetical protein
MSVFLTFRSLENILVRLERQLDPTGYHDDDATEDEGLARHSSINLDPEDASMPARCDVVVGWLGALLFRSDLLRYVFFIVRYVPIPSHAISSSLSCLLVTRRRSFGRSQDVECAGNVPERVPI